MVFTIVNSIEFALRKYKNMKMAIWHITTHFVVEGHNAVMWLCVVMGMTRHDSVCAVLENRGEQTVGRKGKEDEHGKDTKHVLNSVSSTAFMRQMSAVTCASFLLHDKRTYGIQSVQRPLRDKRLY